MIDASNHTSASKIPILTGEQLADDFCVAPQSLAPVSLDSPARPKASATVLRVDRWGRRRAEDISARWRDHDETAWLAHDVDVIADAHEALFAPSPALAERPLDELRAAWWRQLLETPEYRALHAQTMLDPMLSEIASAQICREWSEYAERRREREEREARNRPDGAPAQPAPAPGSDDEPIGEQIERIRSSARALANAQREVETARATLAGLGMGEASRLPTADVRAYFTRVRSNRTLRAIMEMAGRAISLCQSLQRQKIVAERGELTGIELGGDVARLLPSEAAQVAGAVPELELLALYRLAQRRALCYRHRRAVPAARGPIVVSVDESGSMTGESIIAAKGIALALAWLAHHQRRWIMFAGFSGGTEATRYVAPPGRTDQAALLNWVEHFYGGGTTLDVPLSVVPSWWPKVKPPKGQTDHIIITDAEVECADALRDSYRAWARAEGVRTYAIVVGQREPGSLGEVADRCWCIRDLSLDQAAVAEVLSI